MNDLIARLQQSLSTLSPRERVLVALAALCVTLTLLYLAVWEPMASAESRRTADLASARALAAQIEAAAAQVGTQRPARPANRSLSLLAAVDQTSRSAVLGKAPSRVQPEGDRAVKVWVEDVTFNNLLRWLAELEQQYGVSASSAEIEHGSAPGQVSGRLTLVRD